MTKILIAEDERDIRDLVVFTLQFGGFEVVATGNGVELVNAAPGEKPDLILTDVRMPKMTGYEACQALKTNPATKEIPVVFLSAKGQEEEVNKGMEAGAVAYILKPFAPDVLLNKVKEILAEYAPPKGTKDAKEPRQPAGERPKEGGDSKGPKEPPKAQPKDTGVAKKSKEPSQEHPKDSTPAKQPPSLPKS